MDDLHPLPQVNGNDNPASMQSTTTAEQDRAALRTTESGDAVRAGQRHINLIWESTQAVIAVAVTGAVIFAALQGKDSVLLGNAFTLIIAIYFVRMNHTKVGGVGPGSADGTKESR
jgi:hypothetical protein